MKPSAESSRIKQPSVFSRVRRLFRALLSLNQSRHLLLSRKQNRSKNSLPKASSDRTPRATVQTELSPPRAPPARFLSGARHASWAGPCTATPRPHMQAHIKMQLGPSSRNQTIGACFARAPRIRSFSVTSFARTLRIRSLKTSTRAPRQGLAGSFHMQT